MRGIYYINCECALADMDGWSAFYDVFSWILGEFKVDLDAWSTVYWTEPMIIYRCKEKMKVVFDLEKGGKAVTYVYYSIYFIYWNPSFKRRDRNSEL